ncbi:putative ribonuclease H-like domain-containing protein [Tanacetum coccineum]
MLLMALSNEHLMTFNQYKDAKTLFAAIQTRFGGNEAIKKTQKTLLKKTYEKFSAPSTESLDSIFKRLQKIVSQLAILGENISQEDLNLKFLRSLPSEWNTHVVVWRNKPDLDTMSFDDLYNNFKIFEQEVKGTVSSSSSSSSQNMAFVSSHSISTANLSDDTVYAFLASQPNGSQLVYEDLGQIHKGDIEEMDLLSMRTRRFFQKTSRKITINGSDTVGYDKSKVECFNCHKMGHFARECRGPRNQDSRNMNQDSSRRTVNVEETSSKAMVAIDGAGFDWSYMADDEVPTNMALMAFSDSKVHNDKTCSKTFLKSFETLKTQLDDLRIEFNKSEFNFANYKRGLASVEEQLVFYKKNEVIFCEQLAVLKRDISYKDSEISMLKSELEKLKQEKESNQLKIENFDNASKSLDKLIGSQITDKSRKGVGFVSYNAVPPPPTGLFSPPNLDLSYSGLEEFQQPEFEGYGPKPSKSVSEDTSNGVKNMVPRAVLMETGLKVVNTAGPVTTAHPKTTVYGARPMPKGFNTARLNLAVVNVVRANQGHPQKEDQDYVDSGCSRHMTGNMSYLSDFKEFDGGYVTFGGRAKRDKITGKGTLKTSKLDFEDVYFVKELQFNLFSVSEMCDKKNSVLFTDTGCFVLSPDFKFTWVFFLASKDETGGILKSIITEIENLVDKKQNGIAERRNRTLIEAARTMLAKSKLPTTFWTEVGKFDGKSDEGFFVGYSLNSKAFRVYNIRTKKVEERLHIRFLEDKLIIVGTNSKNLNANNDELQPSSDAEKKDDEGVNKESRIDDQERPGNNTQDVNTAGPSINNASTNVNTGSININIVSPIVTTALLEATHADFFGDETELDMRNITTIYLVPSTPNTRIHKDHSLDHVIVEPKKVIQALTYPSWIEAMQDELLHFKLQRVLDLETRQGWLHRVYTQEEGIDYDEVFALVVRIEAIRSYVYQPLGFEDLEFPNRVYKVEKILYGLHQAPRAWVKGLQVTQKDDGIFISQDKFVDEILKKFGFLTVKTASTPMETSKPFLNDAKAKDGDVHLYRSMIGSLMYLTTSRPIIMFVVCACARFQVTPKISHLHAVKRIFRFLKGQPKLGLWYPKDSPFDLEAYTDSDYAGQQTIVSNSTTEAEYVVAASCCGQVLWIQNQMLDYGYNFMNTKIFINNESTICIVKNPVFHSKTKHIEIRHHFIRDSNEKKLIQMIKIHTYRNVVDLLTKAFDIGRFQYLIATAADAIQVSIVGLTYYWYALTENPTIYVLLIQQFWNTATARTLDNGEMEITATIDRKVKIVSEASIRRHLKLEDSDGISNLPTTKIFVQLALMGSKKTAWEQFSINIATAIICLTTNRTFNFSKMIFDGMIFLDYRVTLGFGSMGGLDLACPTNRLPCHGGIQWVLGRITNSLPGVGTDRSPHKSLGTMARVDINTLTLEQYLALSRENQASGVVKLEIKGNVNFEIKSQFMQELREDTFSENKNEDAHDHIDRVLNIVRLFNIPGVSQDVVLLRVFLFTLTGAAKRLLKGLKTSITSSRKAMNRYTKLGNGPIPGMTPTQALTVRQTMADHSQKRHDGTSSKNIDSNSNTDGLAVIVTKLDNLRRDMKKLKENVHAIQVGCQICKGPHLDKECPLNEEVKQVEEVNYGEFGCTTPFNRSNGAKFRVGPPGYYTSIDNQTSFGEKDQLGRDN